MKLYFKFFMINLKSQMQFRLSFLFLLFARAFVSIGVFAGIYFMFLRFNKIEGFVYNEVLLCFSVVFTSFSIAECYARGFDTFSSVISNGEFDRIMVRPRNEIFLVLSSKMEFTNIGRFFTALIVLFYSIPASGIDWTFDKGITLFFMIISGVVIFSGLFLIYAALCFFTLEGLEFMNIFTDGGRNFGQYPYAIYGDGVLKFLTYVVPLALFQYYPLLYITERSSNILYMLTPIIGMLFIIPCYMIWKLGVRKYKSTGS